MRNILIILFFIILSPLYLSAQTITEIDSGEYYIMTLGSRDLVLKAPSNLTSGGPSAPIIADTVFYIPATAPDDTIATLMTAAANHGRAAILQERGSNRNTTITVSQDSLIFGSYGTGNKPVLSGFTTITGWTKRSNTDVYVKKVSTTIDPEILTVNGVQYAMGRTPNANRYNYEADDYFHIDSYSGTTQITDTEVPAATTNWTGAEIVVRTGEKTDWKRKAITNHVSNTLTFADLGEAPANGYGYFIQKDLRTLDQFGEWYFNGTTDTLYFYGDPTGYTIKLSTTDTLINTNEKDNLTFKNLKFEGANSSAIEASYSSDSKIDNCYFDFNYTSILAQTAPDLRITYNTIMRSSDRGIYNHYRGDGYYIAHNTVDSTGLIIGAANGAIDNKTMTAIYAGYAIQSASPNKGIIEYNTIRNTGFYGISFGGDSAIARYNLVDKYCLRLADGGGIHKTGSSKNSPIAGDTVHYRNMQIVDNIVLNGSAQTDAMGFPTGTTNTQINGIYTDVYTFDIDVSRNTVYNSPNGVYILGVQDITFNDNTIYNCDYGVKFHKRADASDKTLPIRNLTGSGNKIIDDRTGMSLVSFKDVHADSLKRFGTFNDNFYSSNIANLTPFEQSIVYTTTDLNQSQWNTATGEDADSYLTFNKGDSTLFDYNNTSVAKTVNITGTYLEADSTEVSTSYTLQPFESIVLFKDTITTINIDSMYAAYPLNANANDSIGTQHGTVTGAVLTASGKFKGAYDFQTNTDNIYFPINTSALTAADSSYSVSFWVKFDNLPSTLGYSTYLFSDIKTGTSYKMAIQVNTSNTIVFQTRNTALTVYTVNSATGIFTTTGVWYHVVVNVPSAGEIGQLYVNGSRTTGGSQNQFAGASRTSDYRFYASKYTGTSGFDGQMDDIVIRKCWTTAAEAADIYDTGAGKYYPFTGQ